MLYTSPWSRFELASSVVIGTDCKGSCKSNYHTITATIYRWPLRMKWTSTIQIIYTLYTYLWCNTRSCSLVINLINWTLNYKHSSENITLKKFACVTWMGKVHFLGGVVFTWIWYIVKGIWNWIILYYIKQWGRLYVFPQNASELNKRE